MTMSSRAAGSRALLQKQFTELIERDPDAGLLTNTQLAARLAVSPRRYQYMYTYLRARRLITRDQHGRIVLLSLPPKKTIPPLSHDERIEAIADTITKSRKPKSGWLRDAVADAIPELPDDRALAEQIIKSTPLAQSRNAKRRAARERRLALKVESKRGPIPSKKRDRKFPPRSDGAIVADKPLAPPVLASDHQRELQRRFREETERAERALAERAQRAHDKYRAGLEAQLVADIAKTLPTVQRKVAPVSAPAKRKTICFACGNLAHRRPKRGKCSCGEYYEEERIEVVMLRASSIARCGE